MIDLSRHDGGVVVLRMHGGENVFTPDFLAAFGAALDEIERADAPAALVTTGEGKFYSSGLALDSLAGQSADEIAAYLRRVHALFARVLAFPRATVAALNGHAFVGGLMLALAHDVRLMRADRGFACLPEVDLRLPLQLGMTALTAARLPKQTAHEATVTGRRSGGTDALTRGPVDAVATESELLPRAIEIARERAAKHPATVAALKRGLHADTLRLLESEAGVAR